MIELIVALGAFFVLLYFSHEPDPPPNFEVEMARAPIPFVWLNDDTDTDDSSYDNADVSDQHSTHTESEESVQKDDCFQGLLSALQTQHFPDATER